MPQIYWVVQKRKPCLVEFLMSVAWYVEEMQVLSAIGEKMLLSLIVLFG